MFCTPFIEKGFKPMKSRRLSVALVLWMVIALLLGTFVTNQPFSGHTDRYGVAFADGPASGPDPAFQPGVPPPPDPLSSARPNLVEGPYNDPDLTNPTLHSVSFLNSLPSQAVQMNWDNTLPDSYFDKLRDSGVKAVRFLIFWGAIQLTPAPSYDFSQYDLKLQKLRERGIVPMMEVYACPDWACGASTSQPDSTSSPSIDVQPQPYTLPANYKGPIPPAYYDAFINFVDAMAQRYYNTPPYNTYNVHYWEFWNEEDLNWDGQEYTALMQRFYQKIKQYDPNNSVVMNGGFAYDGSTLANTFLNSAWANRLDNYVDVVAFHYYPQQYYYTAWNLVDAKIGALKQHFPTTKPLYNNESGAMSETITDPSFSPCHLDPTRCSSPQIQAQYVPKWTLEGIKDRVADNLVGMSWFLMRDYQNDEPFNTNGLMMEDSGYTTKPSYASMRTTLSEISGDDYIADLGPNEGVAPPLEGRHVRPGPGVLNAHAWVVWDNENSGSRTLTLPAVSTQNPNYIGPNLVRAVALDGSAYPVTTGQDGSKTVNVGQDPVYLEWGRFDDVPYSLWAYTYIEYLVTHGVVNGYADYTFYPGNPTLRGQFAKMLVLGLNIPQNTTGGPHFTDVPTSNIYYPYVETIYNAGIVSGYPCGDPNPPCDPQNRPYFLPSNSITRGQLAKMAVLAKGWPLLNPPTPSFVDVPYGSTFYTYVETGHAHNMLAGYPDNTYRPGEITTRAQTSKVIYYAIQQP